jgi:hypothetical protein
VSEALEIWDKYQTTKDERVFQNEVTAFVLAFKPQPDKADDATIVVLPATIQAEVSKLKESIATPKDDPDVDKLLEGKIL